MREELQALIKQYPIFISVPAAAKFLHMDSRALRASIDQGRCPFGFSWKLGNHAGYKIPTITFVNWLTKGVFDPA